MNACFMVPEVTWTMGNGGGNALHNPMITVRRSAAVGDVVAATAIADKLIEKGLTVQFQAHSGIHCVLRRHRGIASITEPHGLADVDLDGCYENHPLRKTKSFAYLYMEKANQDLQKRGISLGKPTNCTPKLYTFPHVKKAVHSRFSVYPRPWVFICPRSHQWQARTVPDDVWAASASKIQGTKLWLGLHPAPKGIVDLQCRHLDNVVDWLSVADMLLTVDTGPMHIAAAMLKPIVGLGQASSPELHLSDQNDYTVLWPEGLDCLNCQLNLCPKDQYMPPCQKFDPDQIAALVNQRLPSSTPRVSGIVSVYKPSAEMLNRCLESILPQVHEIIVCRDLAGRFPEGALIHPKIRYVIKNEYDIGLGRKLNYASRLSCGEWLLHINDDVVLSRDAVAQMISAVKPDTGIVAPVTRYPPEKGGGLYHCGKVREPGVRGWGHLAHKQQECPIKDVTEFENLNGCCLLIRRNALYQSGCYNEDLYLFSEDDDLSLSMRKAGWRLLVNPHATGIHDEHQSVGMTAGGIAKYIPESNAIFHAKWGDYLTANLYRTPMGTFDY